MSLRCAVISCLFLVAQSALIPVEVVYDDSSRENANRNLEEKVQISHDDLLKMRLSDDIINEGIGEENEAVVQGVKNLDAKVQLSQDDLRDVVQHLPAAEEAIKELPISGDEAVKNLPISEAVKSDVLPEQTSPGALESLLKRAETIVYTGINTIKENVDAAAATVAAAKPNQEAWEKLNATLETFFRDQYKSVNLKQDKPPDNNNQNNQNNEFLQNIISGFQSISNNFMSNYFPQNQNSTGSEDEQQGPGNPFQGFISFFQGGITQVVNNLNNQSSTGQEDTGTDNTNNNFFGNVVSQIQQFLNNGNNPTQLVNNQSDTGTQPPNNSGGFLQGAVNQFNQVVNNLRPSTSTPPPAQGDEGTVSSTTQSSNFFQNIGQALQNVNVFGQQTSTQAPGAGGSNFISSGAQAIGSQFGQVTGGQGGSPPIPGAGAIGSQFGQVIGGQGGGSPPIPGAEAIGSQFGQVIGGQGGGVPPIPGAEAIGSQFGQVVGGQGGGVPTIPGAEAIGSQFGQVIGQGGGVPAIPGNPFGGATSSTEKSKSGVEEEKKTESASPGLNLTETVKPQI